MEALYPSLDPTRTGEAIREETIRSDTKLVGVDWAEALKYVRVNITPYQSRMLQVEHLLPDRKFSKGPKPGITSNNSLSGDRGYEDKWVQKVHPESLSRETQSRVMGCCLEIAIKVLFTKHC